MLPKPFDVDTVVDKVAQHLPLTADVAAALMHGEGRLGDVLSTVKAYETVDLEALGRAPVDAGELADQRDEQITRL